VATAEATLVLFAAAEWAAETGVPELVRRVGVGGIGNKGALQN
jgi:hypothetical protein